MINNNEAQLHQNMKKSTSSLDKNMQIGDTSEDQKIEAFIPVVSGLQDVITDTGYKVPQIVVIGDQGSGKSSVLESVVKRDFLPRGIGMITRAPLILQLVNVPENDPRRKEGTNIIDGDWAVFKHKENQKYTDFDEVRKEIENRTIQIAGNAKCITSIPIKLRVYSHRVIDLSLVDLPGIIRMAVGGQPSDMVQQIEKLVYEYIRKQNSIILAVIAANADVATSEALKYAKEVDPEGNRTLAVLTKLDLMDIGTNANDMLTGKIIEVKLGIIGVKLRSQADILSHKSMEKCLMEEEMFLRRNYSLLASKNGVKFLEYKLHELSMNHIRDRLPQLKQNISSVIAEIKHDVGGARISIIFNSVFIQKLDAIDAKANLTEKEILTIIHNSTGAHSALLTPEIAFIKLVKRQIQNLEMPCLQCIEMVFEELYKIAETCYHKIIQKNPRYPKLCEKIFEVVSKLIRSRKEIMKKCVKDLVANELAHINTHHPDFWKQNGNPRANQSQIHTANGSHASSFIEMGEFSETNRTSGSNSILIPSTEKKVVNTLTDDDKRNLAIVEYLIPHYFAIVRTKLQDMVPKSIMRLLVNYVKDEIYNELVKEIILNKNLENLLAEGPAIQSRKKELKGMLYALEQAVMESAKLQDKPIEYTDGENESDDENEDDSQPNRMENGEAEVFHNYIQNGNFHPNMVHGQYMGNP
uniref:Dynamin GTPase n=1 Tax=Acrobeloides nanus TaxID=290746 RepID=A0A914E0F8_9BILA